MVQLLDVDESGRARLVHELGPVAVGLAELGHRQRDPLLGSVRDDLLSAFEAWPVPIQTDGG